MPKKLEEKWNFIADEPEEEDEIQKQKQISQNN